jgi:hypothetical protein
LKSGLYFKTRNRPPIEVPEKSLAASIGHSGQVVGTCEFESGIWLRQPCQEHVILSEQYDFTLSLLHFEDAEYVDDMQEDPIEDASDRIRASIQRGAWKR